MGLSLVFIVGGASLCHVGINHFVKGKVFLMVFQCLC